MWNGPGSRSLPGRPEPSRPPSRIDEKGGYPFDKSLTAYFSGLKQPVVLRLRGVTHDKQLPLWGDFIRYRFGNLAFKKVDIKGGNVSQGQQKSGTVLVANLGNKPLSVSFSDVSEGLSVKVSPNPVPAQSTAKLNYTVTADRNHWGRTVLCDSAGGRRQ